MKEHILDAWAVHARSVIYLLQGIDDKALTKEYSDKSRTVGEIFRHIHNNRLLWVDDAVPELVKDMKRLSAKDAEDKKVLAKALEESANVVLKVISKTLKDGKVEKFKRHPITFLSYLIAHEGFHEGEISLMLTQMDMRLKPMIAFGLWDWENR